MTTMPAEVRVINPGPGFDAALAEGRRTRTGFRESIKQGAKRAWSWITRTARRFAKWVGVQARNTAARARIAWDWLWERGSRAASWVRRNGGTAASWTWGKIRGFGRWTLGLVKRTPEGVRRALAWPGRIVSSGVLGVLEGYLLLLGVFALGVRIIRRTWKREVHTRLVDWTRQDNMNVVTPDDEVLRYDEQASAAPSAQPTGPGYGTIQDTTVEIATASGEKVHVQVLGQQMTDALGMNEQELYNMLQNREHMHTMLASLSPIQTTDLLDRYVMPLLIQGQADRKDISYWFGVFTASLEFSNQGDRLFEGERSARARQHEQKVYLDKRDKQHDPNYAWFRAPDFQAGWDAQVKRLMAVHAPAKAAATT